MLRRGRRLLRRLGRLRNAAEGADEDSELSDVPTDDEADEAEGT